MVVEQRTGPVWEVPYLRETCSKLLDQSQIKNGSALSQSGRMRPPNRRRQRATVYDGLHKKREGGKARADRRAPSQTSTATPRTPSCRRYAVGIEASAIHPAYIGIKRTIFINILLKHETSFYFN